MNELLNDLFTIEEKAHNAALKSLFINNPYIDNSIKFNEGNEEKYIFADQVFTREFLNAEYIKTAEKDFLNGYKDRKVGYYDKWYRYSRLDEGRAYDLGVKEALKEDNTPADMNIIPCIH